MSSIVDRLIAENRTSRSPVLDLSNCGLDEIPVEVCKLTWLEGLYLSQWRYEKKENDWKLQISPRAGKRNRILRLPVELEQLSRLKTLNIDIATGWIPVFSNIFRYRSFDVLINLKTLEDLQIVSGELNLAILSKIKKLKNLSLISIALSDLSPLWDLTGLQSLNICACSIYANDLKPLSSLNKLQSLSLDTLSISDLNLLSGLNELQTLELSEVQVSDLSPLSSLSKLQSLSLDTVPISDLSPLSGLNELQTLELSEVQVSDLSPLSSLSKLQSLSLNTIPMSDLSSLSGLNKLQSLKLDKIQVSDLSPLSNLNKLESLDLWRTQLISLSPLSNLFELRELSLHEIQVHDLSSLSCLNSLRFLTLWETLVGDPRIFSNLTNLQILILWETSISDLSSLSDLSNLKTLILQENSISNLKPISDLNKLETLSVHSNLVNDLNPLSRLDSLKSLVLSSTSVRDLRPLSGLSSLEWLDLSSTLVSDLRPLSGLSLLEWLDLSSTSVSDLQPLSGLVSLKSLDLSSTSVRDLRPLSGLRSLRSLDLCYTKVSDLSPLLTQLEYGMLASFLEPLSELENFVLSCIDRSSTDPPPKVSVYGCPLTRPPPELITQGPKAILNYFREIQSQGVDNLYEAKMLIVGEGGAGKTSLLRRLYLPDQPLPKGDETTKGIDIHQEDFLLPEDRRFRLNIWDFGGQEIYHATHQFFLTKRSLYVLLDDTRTNEKSVTDAGFKYWLEVIELLSDKSPVLIFQNEKGGRSKDIDIKGIKRRFSNVQGVYRGNLYEADSADALREAVEFFVKKLPHIGDEVPAKWVSIRDEIKKITKQKSYIFEQEYFEIYSHHLEFDRQKALFLSEYLHDLGVFLHFQDHELLNRVVILQNEWATEAVFRILDNESIKQRRGRFTLKDCEQLWFESSYAAMYPELLALMEKFELCYLLPDIAPKTWLAPQLLLPSKPEMFIDWESVDDLVLSYRYNFLPKGLISRLMVRMNRYVKQPDLAWASGVLFELGNTQLLVQIAAMPKGDAIMLRARGPDSKTLLSVISEDLEALNISFAGLEKKVDKLVPCKCSQCRNSLDPEFFEQKKLLRRKEHNQLTDQCDRSYEMVSVLELLDGLKVDVPPPSWVKDDEQSQNETIGTPMKTIKIFLASSAELSAERDAFDLYFRQQKDSLMEKGLYLKIVRWENFLDAMSETRLQEEYNQAVRDCDIFVSLFLTKTGQFTEEEFDVAHRTFKETGKPLVYTFFKNDKLALGGASRDSLMSLWKFQDKLKELGHYYTQYDNLEHLKRLFRDQLDKLQEQGKI